MMKLFTIIQKNFKILLRSKVSALIIFLGPLLLVSLIGMSFSNTQLPGLTVGTYAPNYNDFTNSIVSKVEENKFTIHKFDTEELCSNAVKRADASICLIFPKDMSADNNEVRFVVDYSKINLVWIVVDIFSTKVSERATELRTSYATDLLDKVVKTKSDLDTDKAALDALTKNQEESQSVLGSAKATLGKIDPQVDLGEDVDADDARASLSAIAAKINTAQDKLDDAKTAVDGSSLSTTEKDAVNDKLNAVGSNLAGAELYVQGNGSTKSLEYIVLSLDSALQNAKSQLSTIKQQRDSVNGELTTLDASLTEAINSASSISNSVNDMVTRLSSVQSSDAQRLVSPIKTKIEPVTSQETHFNYLFPTLMVLIVMITAVLLSSTLVMNEKKSRSAFRNFITPTSDLVFNLGTFLSAFLVLLIQLVIFLFISMLFFETDVFSSLGSSSLLLFLITSTFILLGMVIGFLFKSEETYVLASITVSALLLFLSSTVMPIESISDSVRSFAAITPFVVSETTLRQVMFFNFNLVSLWKEMLILAGYIIVFVGAIAVMHKAFRFNISLKKKEKK